MKKQTRIQSYILVCSLIALAGLGCSLAGQAALALPDQPTLVSSRASETPQDPLYLLDLPTDTPEAVLIGLDEPTPENEPTPTAALATPEDQGMLTSPYLYYVQAGDTLPVVAVRFGVKPEEVTSPEPIPATSLLNPGQLLIIPRKLANTTSSEHLMPDSEVVNSPSATDFDVTAFIDSAGGYLSRYTQWLQSTGVTTGAAVVARVAVENSINPRLLLSLMEYETGWVYGEPSSDKQILFPMGNTDPKEDGLYNQLTWAVNQLSIGYYGWREGRLTEFHFSDGVVARLAPDLNAGTAALQYFFSQLEDSQGWLKALDPNEGLPALHQRMFGSPWSRALVVEPLYPPDLVQPPLILPFTLDTLWAFSGGPHGAWERDGAQAALDFAPGSSEAGCVDSNAQVVAASAGLIVRSGNGVVVIDLDGDGREQTGWTLMYLHVSKRERIAKDTWVQVGDVIGHPSCEGGRSTGTHIHIARKYNGEWIPADGPMPFVLSGWTAHGGDLPYIGTLERGDQVIRSSVLGIATSNIYRRANDP